MTPNNPATATALHHAKEKLALLKAEKLKHFPPNPHPFAEPDRYPRDYTPAQIQQRNALIEQIEELERHIEKLERQLAH